MFNSIVFCINSKNTTTQNFVLSFGLLKYILKLYEATGLSHHKLLFIFRGNFISETQRPKQVGLFHRFYQMAGGPCEVTYPFTNSQYKIVFENAFCVYVYRAAHRIVWHNQQLLQFLGAMCIPLFFIFRKF